MKKIIFLYLMLCVSLLSVTQLDTLYYVKSNNVKLRDILPEATYDVTLYKIEKNKYSKKVKANDLLKALKEHGFENIKVKSRFVKFVKKSPVDLSKIENHLYKMYTKKYKNIKINSLKLIPRSYLTALPDRYTIKVAKKAYLLHKSIVSIKTIENKKIYFDYILDAEIEAYASKRAVKKGEIVSLSNVSTKNIVFDKFRAQPIDSSMLNNVQYKFNIRNDKIISIRDVDNISLVRKGSNVNVFYKNANINISFLATALQNGKLNDIIMVQKRNKQKIKVKVIGRNRVEIK